MDGVGISKKASTFPCWRLTHILPGNFTNRLAEDIDNQMSVVMGITEAAKRGDARAAGVLLKMLGEETVQEDPAADALEAARKLLGGVDSAID